MSSQLVSISQEGNLYRVNFLKEIDEDNPAFLFANSSSRKNERFFIVEGGRIKERIISRRLNFACEQCG